MARSMWRGAIQFGLVTIPVKLYLATESRGGLSFNLLHKDDLQRIQMKTYCPEHGEISRSDTVRGYEWSKGQYVVIEEEDFEKVPLKTVRAIEIEQFVPADRGGYATTFVKQAYYIEPEAVGRKAFLLLRQVLAEQGLQAVCKIVLKDREVLCAMDPFDGHDAAVHALLAGRGARRARPGPARTPRSSSSPRRSRWPASWWTR